MIQTTMRRVLVALALAGVSNSVLSEPVYCRAFTKLDRSSHSAHL